MQFRFFAFLCITLASSLRPAMLEFSSFPEGKGFMFLTYRQVTQETLLDIINETVTSTDHPITVLRLSDSDDLSALPDNMFDNLPSLEHLFIHGMKEHILPDSILQLRNLKEFLISPNRNIYDHYPYPYPPSNKPFRIKGHKVVQTFLQQKIAQQKTRESRSESCPR